MEKEIKIKTQRKKSLCSLCLSGGIILLLLAVSCSGEPGVPQGKVKVFVSIPPQAYFVERVGGSHVAVEVLVGPGQSPHTFEPTPKQMAKLSEAQMYFHIGVPFEKALLPRIESSFERLEVVDISEGIKCRATAGHGGELGPHIWLSPRNVKVMAANIRNALEKLDPAHAGDYDKNLAGFQKELDLLDGRIARMLSPLKGRKFHVFHPAFGHFADAYGLEQAAVEREGKEPGAKQLAALIEEAKKEGVKVIFVQPQFSAKSAEAVAKAIGARIETIDPLAPDYLKNLHEMAEKIEKGLRGE